MTTNGFLTDTSYCNILLFDGTDWITPENPLYKGVQRECLLDEKIIKVGEIHERDLNNYEFFMLVNAMFVFKEKVVFHASLIQ